MNHDSLEKYGFENGRVVRALRVGPSSIPSAVENRAEADLSAASAWWQSFLRGGEVFADEGAAKKSPIRIVDAFCGCGGFTLGAAQAAISVGRRLESVAAIDVDLDGLRVHEKNFGTRHLLHANASALVDWNVSGEGDSSCFAYEPEIIDPVLAEQVDSIDLFIAGPPCQGHSSLNNKTRREDPRNLLYVTAIALGVGLRAKAIVLENVPEVINDKSDVVSVGKALLRAAGYTWVDSGVLATDHLGGAQTRKRYFLVATRPELADGALLMKDVARQLRQPPQPLRWAIEDLLQELGEPRRVSIMDTVPTMSADNATRIKHLFDHNLHVLPDEVRPDSHKNGHTYPSVYGRMYWEKPAQTITTGFLTPGRGRHIHPLRQRVITPHEAARIQTFPDTFSFVVDADAPPSRQSLQKWIGDAVPPLLGYAALLPLMLRM